MTDKERRELQEGRFNCVTVTRGELLITEGTGRVVSGYIVKANPVMMNEYQKLVDFCHTCFQTKEGRETHSEEYERRKSEWRGKVLQKYGLQNEDGEITIKRVANDVFAIVHNYSL